MRFIRGAPKGDQSPDRGGGIRGLLFRIKESQGGRVDQKS